MHVAGRVKGSLRRTTPAPDPANHVKCNSTPKPPPHQRIEAVHDQRSHGFLKSQWPSGDARRTRVRLRKTGDPQEPLAGTLAADEEIQQEWDGVDMPAGAWCTSEADDIQLRELKHTYADGNRVLSLLMLESAPPRTYFRSGWEDEETRDTFDRFINNGQLPVR